MQRNNPRKGGNDLNLESKVTPVAVKNGVTYITFPKLNSTGLVRCGFTTKLGGASSGCFSTMNMSFDRGDDRACVLENYRRFCSALELDMSELVFSRQTHTSNVKTVNRSHCGIGITRPPFEDIDGLITAERGVALVTQYADCTPLLFCDPVKKVIAASHSGWRGTVKQIGAATVRKMQEEFGSDPKDIIAAIGPCIGPCCYEVDLPVYEEFKKLPISLSGVLTPSSPEHFMLDLRLANKRILQNAGISEANIEISDICTCCNSDLMFSHRRSGARRGNLAAVISLI